MKINYGTLLITGGTGSFGESFLLKAIDKYDFNEIRIFTMKINQSLNLFKHGTIIMIIKFGLLEHLIVILDNLKLMKQLLKSFKCLRKAKKIW